jgi:hypothetical protein
VIVGASLFGWGRMGGWGGGFGGGGAGLQGIATRADISEGFALNNITSGITAIQQGICDSTYALNNAITGGFHGVDSALCTLSHQLSDCCCATQRAIDGVNYNMATNFSNLNNTLCGLGRDIIDNQNANTRSIMDFLVNDKISTLTAENQALKFAASQASQNAFITANQEAQTAEIIRRLGRDCPVPAYVVPNPNCCYGNPSGVGYGFGGGCGCGCAA